MRVRDRSKYKLGHPLSSTLLRLVSRSPQLVVLTERFFDKIVHYSRVWTEAKEEEPHLAMGDLVKFCCQLRKDLKKNKASAFATSADAVTWFQELKDLFDRQMAVDKDAGIKYVETRTATILDRCQKLLLLSLVQAHVRVLEATRDPSLLNEFSLQMERQGFPVENGSIEHFVNSVKKSLQRGRLPPFVNADDHGHFRQLLDAYSPPLSRSTIKPSKKTPVPPVSPSHARSSRKRTPPAVSPASPPSPDEGCQPKPKTMIGRLKECQKILLMRQVMAFDCSVLLRNERAWTEFFHDLWKIDPTIPEKQSRIHLQHLKLRSLVGSGVPSFSQENRKEGMEVFYQLRKAFGEAEEKFKNKKAEVAVGRYIITRLYKIPELLERQLTLPNPVSKYLMNFAKEVSKIAGKDMSLHDIHQVIQQWKNDFHLNQLPSFIYGNKYNLERIERISGEVGDHAVNGSKSKFQTTRESKNKKEAPPDAMDYIASYDVAGAQSPSNVAPLPSMGEEMQDDDDMGSDYSYSSTRTTTTSITSSHYTLDGYSDWDSSDWSAAESDVDDLDDIFNPFRERMEPEQAAGFVNGLAGDQDGHHDYAFMEL